MSVTSPRSDTSRRPSATTQRAWVAGLAIMVGSEAATLAGLEPFRSWNTPICWTGFIIFADAIVARARGNSWLRSSPREFVFLAITSIPLWLVFEFFNRFIQNWYYVGLPGNTALRMFGYAWAFATIWPAIFEGAELVAVWRAAPAPLPGRGDGDPGQGIGVSAPHGRGAAASEIAGAAMLVSPFVVPSDAARYLAAPVWLGFIFLLDPINARLGGPSLWADWRNSRTDRLVNLLLSGLVCGILWEFWNYWAAAKWHYTVPIFAQIKLFEMPLPGYLGFPAFALECFTMYVFVRLAWRGAASGSRRGTDHLGRPIAL